MFRSGSIVGVCMFRSGSIVGVCMFRSGSNVGVCMFRSGTWCELVNVAIHTVPHTAWPHTFQ